MQGVPVRCLRGIGFGVRGCGLVWSQSDASVYVSIQLFGIGKHIETEISVVTDLWAVLEGVYELRGEADRLIAVGWSV